MQLAAPYPGNILRGLSAKLLLVAVPLFLVFSIPCIYLLVEHELGHERDELALRIGNRSARVATLLTRRGGLEDRSLIRDLLATLADDQAFVCAELRAVGAARPMATIPAYVGCAGQAAAEQLTVPVGQSGEAQLTVRFSDAEIAHFKAERQTLAQLVVGLSFLFAILAGIVGFRLIVGRPLGALLSAIRTTSESGVRKPLEYRGKDELGIIISAFNEMLERDSERERALESTNADLVVSKRKLKALNEALESGIERRTGELEKQKLALIESEQRFRHFAEASSDWFWEMDENLGFSYFSDRFSDVTGVPQEMLLGKTREETGIPDVDLKDWEEHLANLHAHRPFRNFAHPRTKADGRIVWLSINGKPVFDESGNFNGYRGAGTDITKLKAAEEQLEKQSSEVRRQAAELERALKAQIEFNNLQREFVSMASHEFRTPLTIIDSTTQSIVRRLDRLDRKSIEERLEIIRGAVARILSLIESTLNASRMDAGRIEYNPEEVDLRGTIEEVAKRLQEVYPLHKISLSIDEIPKVVDGDPRLLDQVITNLLSNAIKYSPDATNIEIVGGREDDNVVVSISDRGLGIPKDELSRLFQRYFRARTSTGIPGTGIGLNLVKQFVEMHGGSIGVQSTEGDGSTFTIRLPIRHGNWDAPESSGRGPISSSMQDMNISVAR